MHTLTIPPFDDPTWTVVDDGFVGLVGPFFFRDIEGGVEVAVACQDKHRNRRGPIHGGFLMTFADRALVIGAQKLGEVTISATIQFDIHFVAPVQVGDILVARPSLIPGTKSLKFLRTDLTVGDTIAASATGIFRPNRPE